MTEKEIHLGKKKRTMDEWQIFMLQKKKSVIKFSFFVLQLHFCCSKHAMDGHRCLDVFLLFCVLDVHVCDAVNLRRNPPSKDYYYTNGFLCVRVRSSSFLSACSGLSFGLSKTQTFSTH